MRWLCKSCKQLQENSWLGFFFHKNINCDKCIEFDRWIKEERRKKLIKDRDDAILGQDVKCVTSDVSVGVSE